MKILFYRYGSICEPAILRAFHQLGITVVEETAEITDKTISPSACVSLIDKGIKTHHPLFVFSINFYPAIAEICHIHRVLYVCWTVDSPVMELFSPALRYDSNRIFLFDRAQYDYFHHLNPENIYHLPLASDTEHFDSVVQTIQSEDRLRYASDICFVGSLYSEKNPLKQLPLSNYAKGYITGLVHSALELYGYNPIPDALSNEIIAEFKPHIANTYSDGNTTMESERYLISHSYIGMQAAETERVRTLNKLAEHFPVDLYTRSNTADLKKITVHAGIKTLSEMPKAFHLSKINLNMTIKPIQAGLPLRIFDILGCGGFLMTNYQPELTDHFQIGTDLEAYSSLEELIDKCHYYLTHEEARRQIAQNGYLKVKETHTFRHRLFEMLRIITASL